MNNWLPSVDQGISVRLVVYATIATLCGAIAANATEFPLLDQVCERALALSAAPAHLQDDASVYVLKDDGYTLINTGGNPYTCIVQRNHPTSLLPVCFDKEGTDTIVKTIIGTADLVLEGKTDTEINAAIVAGLQTAKYSEPVSSSISYMLSDFNWMYDENAKELNNIGPHSMIFAQDASRESIHFNADSYRFHNVLPLIAGMGPFSYFVVRAENPTDSTSIEKHCGDSLSFLPE